MRIRGAIFTCLFTLAIAGTAQAGWEAAEPVGTNINQIQLAPGGPGYVVGFPATTPSRVRFALRPLTGKLENPLEFPAGIGQHTLPAWGFDAAGNLLFVDEELHGVAWRSADGEKVSATQIFKGHLLARWPRLISVAPSGDALIGVNEVRPGGSPVQLAFRPAGINSTVDTENTVDLTNNGTLIGIQLQADGGAIAVYFDEATKKLMQVVRRSGQSKFDEPTEIASPPGTFGRFELSFSSDSSGWAMLGWSGSSTEGGAPNQALGAVRAPDGSFPTATVVGTGASISNATPAVTTSGDGLLTWKQTGLGNLSCQAFAIRGAPQHLGTWSPAIDVGPSAWPDSSVPATASTSFSSGNDISVPMIDIHEVGEPCPKLPQTRALIVHHYRSVAGGLSDQGTSTLTAFGNSASVEGWAMEPAGKIFAWYRVGEERFLRSFDGVTPGGGGVITHETPKSPPANGGGTTPPPVTPPAIKPLVLQQFAIVPTISPKDLEFEMRCPPPTPSATGQMEDICAGRAYFYYLFTGKQIKAFNARSAAAKKRLLVIATGTISIKAGHKGHVKLRPNKLGRALLKTHAKLKITLKLSVKLGGRSFTGSLPATIKARGRH